jgi:5-methylcytosine-specific restriction enzyme subunit McrC
VIARTVFEWGYVAVEPAGPKAFSRIHAERLLSVARASPLGGRDGVRILTDHHRKLRAQQVVGIIAAEGCRIEILPKIDMHGSGEDEVSRGSIRRQLVHMLAVALDLEVTGGALTDLDWQKEDMLEILVGMFVRKLADALRHGMPRRYLGHEEDLPALRGRLDATRQFTVLATAPHRLACRFDALSPDIPLNRIMKAAVTHLAAVSRSGENRRRLRELAFLYADIAALPAKALPWDAVVLDRTNGAWRDLISLAKLLLRDRLQNTSSGGERGFSLLFEMNTLFEEYVGRTLARVLAGSGLSVHLQAGRLFCLQEEESEKKRFQTRPDILVKRGAKVEMVIDTKWKNIASRLEDPKQGVSQGDVYQMMAYGRIYECPRLTLLYPHHAKLGTSPAITRHRVALPGCEDRLDVSSVEIGSHAEARRCVAALTQDI